MDFTKIKVIKTLGAGMYATTYLVELDGKQYARRNRKFLKLTEIEIRVQLHGAKCFSMNMWIKCQKKLKNSSANYMTSI